MKPRVKIKERIAKAKEKFTGIPVVADRPNANYEANYNIIKLKIGDRFGKNPVEHPALRINSLNNLGFSSKGITRQNLLEIDYLIKKCYLLLKKKKLKLSHLILGFFLNTLKLKPILKRNII